MRIPFTAEQFFEVFGRYNEAVWPMQPLLVLLALTALGAIVSQRPWSSAFVCGSLAFLWTWMASAYHLAFFRRINPAAIVFAALFLVQALAFLRAAWRRDGLGFRLRGDASGWLGALLVLYALVLYPWLGHRAGHVYPHAPTFGLPCPTTIFTFGILYFARRPVPRYLLLIPLLWALIGLTAAFELGVPEDLGLLLAVLAGLRLLEPRRLFLPRD